MCRAVRHILHYACTAFSEETLTLVYCVRWFMIDGALFIHWVRNHYQCRTDGVNRQTFKTLPVGCSIILYQNRYNAPSSLSGQMLPLLYHYLVLFLSVLLRKLHTFCRIITQSKPIIVTSCLSICFIPNSNERLSVKFSIWSVHRILDLRNFGSRL